jgi:hypothetical protein
MLTYVGKGYSPAFVENYDRIAGRLSEGEDILLVDGPDNICAPLLCGGDCQCFGASVRMRVRLALEAVGDLIGQRLATQNRFGLDAERLAVMRAAFAEGTLRKACKRCEWSNLCTGIATTDQFHGVKITRPSVSG